MAIESIPSNDRRERFIASAGQTQFPFDFPVYAATDLDVRRFRGGVESVLAYGADYTVAGAGGQGGGIVTLTAGAAAADLLVIRSAQPTTRTSRFYGGGDLPAETLNAEFNRLWIELQQLGLGIGQALRLPASDPTDAAELATATSRANAVLGFGAAGEVQLIPRTTIGGSSFQQTGTGAVVRATQDELAERIHPKQFGAAGDGSADDTLALQRAANEAAARGAYLSMERGTFRTTDTVTVPGGAAGVLGGALIRYDGPAGRSALILGDAGGVANRSKRYLGLRVERVTQADWTNEADIGVQAWNMDGSLLEVVLVKGFTIGLQTAGDQRGFEDSTITLGRIWNCRYGLDVRTATASAWNNAVRYIGGHFAIDSALHPTLSRFGVRLSKAAGAYDLHNHHVFVGPGFELQRQGTPGTVDAIPFLLEVSGRALEATGIRMEACSPYVARHTAAFNDATYDVAYVGTYGFLGCGVDYPAGATRSGGTVRAQHQAAAVQGSPRLVAACPDLRAAAFRNTVTAAGGVGFEGLAVLSSNPAGPPSTLNGFTFGGLALMTLNAEDVTLPTSRALAFIVDCADAKDFVIAAEGVSLRPVIMQFDAAENVLDGGSAVLFSNANAVWAGSPSYFWEMNVDLDELTGGLALNRLQRVRLHPNAKFAAIGVRGGSASASIKALRLFASALDAPRVLAGGSRAWGTREIWTSVSWTVPALAAGATATLDVNLPGVRQGDLLSCGFAKDSGFQNGGVVMHAVAGGTGSTDQVRVTAQNVSSGSITAGAGTLFVYAKRPRN